MQGRVDGPVAATVEAHANLVARPDGHWCSAVEPGEGMLGLEPGGAGGLSEDRRRAEGADAGNGEKVRSEFLDQAFKFTFQGVDLRREFAAPRHQLTGDP